MDFKTKAETPEFWFEQSKQLFYSAKAMFSLLCKPRTTEEIDAAAGFHKSSMFLLGISIENAYKGYIARVHGLEFKEYELNEKVCFKLKTKTSFKECRNHDLVALANLVDVGNDEEVEMLERLSIYTIWAGKYGTPIDEKDFICKVLENKKNDVEQEKNMMSQNSRDFYIAENLINRLANVTVSGNIKTVL